ncbi:GldG family protein [Leptospira sp. GIMC2001]|uniref:GldG family protein n=1 Tax=Leptospira sp. GIMC2001 TaxID=1513297 RepID=UPI00234BFAF7|nr:GldG family protein [Leptospira sp. GIMC2001]WCL48424.1 GldG family protein [Leptospira sp. GIMC2001]
MIGRLKLQLETRFFILGQIVLFFFASNYLMSSFNCRLDISKSGRFQLTDSTKKIVNELQETVYIDAYYSSDIPAEYKARITLAQEILKEIQSVNSNKVKLRFYDPDSSESDKERAIELGIEPQTLQKIEMSSAQVKSAFLGVSLTMGKLSETIPVVFFAEEVEYQILSNLKKMIRKQKNASSGLGIIVEEGSLDAPQPGPRSGKDTFGVFVYQAFAPEYGSVFSFGVNEDPLPEDLDTVLIVGSPELTDLGRYHIDQFLMRGGNLLIFAKSMDFNLQSPSQMGQLTMGSQGFAQPVQNISGYNEFFSHYGFSVNTDMVFDKVNSMPMGPIVQTEQGGFGRYHYPLWVLVGNEADNFSTSNPITRDQEILLLPWVSSLEMLSSKQPNVVIEPVIKSTASAFRKADYLFIGEKEVAKMDNLPDGEEYNLALHLKGKFISYFKDKTLPQFANQTDFKESNDEGTESNIFVMGTPYLVSDLLILREFRELYQGANVPFLMNLIDIVQGDEDLVLARSKKPAFESLKTFSPSEEWVFSILNIFALPFLIGIFAIVRLKSRNQGKWRNF